VPCPAHVGPFQGLHVNLIARLSDNLSDRGPEEVPKPAHQPSVLYLHPCRSLIADLMHLARWLRDTLRVQDTLTLFLFPTLFECKKRLETAAVTHSAWHTRGYCFIHRPRPTRMSFLSGVAVWPTSLQCRRTLLSTLHMPATTWRHAAVVKQPPWGHCCLRRRFRLPPPRAARCTNTVVQKHEETSTISCQTASDLQGYIRAHYTDPLGAGTAGP